MRGRARGRPPLVKLAEHVRALLMDGGHIVADGPTGNSWPTRRYWRRTGWSCPTASTRCRIQAQAADESGVACRSRSMSRTSWAWCGAGMGPE